MSKLYRCCEGLRESDWSRYTRLEVSGSKDHDGETEAMVYATDAEFFTVYGRLPSFEVEPVTDCYDAVTLLAVAAEFGFRSKLDAFCIPRSSILRQWHPTPVSVSRQQPIPTMGPWSFSSTPHRFSSLSTTTLSATSSTMVSLVATEPTPWRKSLLKRVTIWAGCFGTWGTPIKEVMKPSVTKLLLMLRPPKAG